MHFLHGSIDTEFLAAAQQNPKYGSQQKRKAVGRDRPTNSKPNERELDMAYANTTTNTIFDRVRAIFADLTERAARAKVYRTTLGELKELSNRELADLGIHRSEIKRIAYEAAYKN
ncbi:MAG: DUF1127 domain-containing protein [Pseudomonadota bacterium]